MNVFVAGASGAIGRRLVAELVRRGHAVTGMTRSDAGATALARLGAAVARVSAFDAPGLEQALRGSKAEVVIDELPALPKDLRTSKLNNRRWCDALSECPTPTLCSLSAPSSRRSGR